MNKNYRIYMEFGKKEIKTGNILRIDLFKGFKLKDIPELKMFNIVYEQKGHNETDRKVRYIRVFEKRN